MTNNPQTWKTLSHETHDKCPCIVRRHTVSGTVLVQIGEDIPEDMKQAVIARVERECDAIEKQEGLGL